MRGSGRQPDIVFGAPARIRLARPAPLGARLPLADAPGSAREWRARAPSSGGNPASRQSNPDHRQVIDLPGRRFSVDDPTIVDSWASGVVIF